MHACPPLLGLSANRLLHPTSVILRSLHCNRLLELPEELGCAVGLNWLSANGNRLSRIPESIGRCRKLVRLGLHVNLLEEIPASIGELTNLEAL